MYIAILVLVELCRKINGKLFGHGCIDCGREMIAMKKVDFEYHFYLPEVLRAMGKWRKYPWYDENENVIHWTENTIEPQREFKAGLYQDWEQRITHMDRYGISAAVLSSGPGVEELPIATSVELCRKINNDIYDHIKRYPGRFYGSAALPIGNIQAACDEMKRCVLELGFSAWQAPALLGELGIDDDRFFPVFETVSNLGAYVFVYPRCSFYHRLEGFGFPLAGAGLGYTIETQITVMRMVLKGLFERLPDLTVIIGHLGEGLPYFSEYLQRRLKRFFIEENKMEHELDYYFQNNIMISTGGNTSRAAFECAKSVLGIDRIVLGTNNPYESPSLMMDFLDTVSLTTEERARLYYKNAEKLFDRVKR